MPRPTRGSVYETKNGYGIRWVQDGRRQHRSGFRTKTEAREWWGEHIRPVLRRGGPSGEITLAEFAPIYLDRWGADVSPRTRKTLEDWLKPSLKTFGEFKLRELEGAADDVAHWRAALPSDDRRYKATRGLRQVLAAAVRWKYMAANPALDMGQNPEPRSDEINPPTRIERDRILEEMAPKDAALVLFASETGLRTNEWQALERKDIDWQNPGVAVARRFSTKGGATPYPKTQRRRVPLTPRAVEALGMLPPRIDTPYLFPSAQGHHIDLDNWRLRVWYPALEAAGVEKRGPYELRHFYASESLAAGISIFELARLMGASVKVLERHYGHLVQGAEESILARLAARDAAESRRMQGEM